MVSARTNWQTLALAAEIRRVWRDHPEFAQTHQKYYGNSPRWQNSVSAYTTLSWPHAAKLAESWASYPDIEEVQHFLEQLFEEWRYQLYLQHAFFNFQHFLHFVVNNASDSLDDWAESFFDVSEGYDDPFVRLESLDCWPKIRTELFQYRIDLPRARKPTQPDRE